MKETVTIPRNPFQLAVLLHYEPDRVDASAPSAAGAARVVDHWLARLDHHDPLIASEYLEAPALLAELLAMPGGPAARRARIEDDERFHHWGLCRHLLDETTTAGIDPRLAWEWCDLATAIGERLDESLYDRARSADLRARAWSALAEALHRLGRREAALRALARAEWHAEGGTGSSSVALSLERLAAEIEDPRAQRGTEGVEAKHDDEPTASTEPEP